MVAPAIESRERKMKRTIVLVDHQTGKKFRIIIDPKPSCQDCGLSGSGLQETPFAMGLRESFDRELKQLRVICARCGKELGVYPAVEV